MILVRPTFRGKLMLLTFIAATVAAFVNVNLTTCLFASFMGGMLFASFFLAFFSLYRISLQRLGARDGVKGSKMHLPVTLVNKSNRHRQILIIREHCEFVPGHVLNSVIEPMAPKETRVISRTAIPEMRGLFHLDRITLVGGDPTGFFAREKTFSFPDEIMIYPESERINWMPLRIKRQIQFSVEGRPLGISGLGQDFFGIREYHSSDGMRFIHWKASAKHQQLLVKEFESHAVSQVCIVLDVDQRSVSYSLGDSNFEFLIKTVASIADYLAGMYCRLLFITAGENKEVIRIEGEAFGVKEQIIHTLATLKAGKCNLNDLLDASIELYRPNSILYFLTMSDPEGVAERFDMLLDRRVDIRWIFAPACCFEEHDKTTIYNAVREYSDEENFLAIRPYIADKDIPIARMLSYG